jgi:hypothetical protein
MATSGRALLPSFLLAIPAAAATSPAAYAPVVHDVSEVIRHMMYEAKADAMWFGTDANRIGRVVTRRAVR